MRLHNAKLRRRGGRGITLIEMLIAVSITAAAAGVVATLVSSTSTATSAQADGRRNLARIQAAKAIIGDELHNARAILASGSNYLIWWSGDNPVSAVTPNRAVNLSELRLLEVDTTTNELKVWAITWPDNYSASNIIAADTAYAANSNWYNVCQAAKNNANFTSAMIISNCTGMTVTLDASSFAASRMASCTLTITDQNITRRVLVSGSIRTAQWPE